MYYNFVFVFIMQITLQLLFYTFTYSTLIKIDIFAYELGFR